MVVSNDHSHDARLRPPPARLHPFSPVPYVLVGPNIHGMEDACDLSQWSKYFMNPDVVGRCLL